MSFQPKMGQEWPTGGVIYRIAEHPAAPGMPYGQEGRQAVVYQLISPDGAARALKVFKPRYRLPALVRLTDKLAPCADLSGLAACRRTVLTPQTHAVLLRQHPDLIYAVLMPWIEGPTWMEILLSRRVLTPAQSVSLARGLAEVLSRMEQQGLAHCDLSGPNVLLPALLPSPVGRGAGGEVALVDVEGMYGPGLEHPPAIASGSPGYHHKTAADGLWSADADRFAGAVLLAEMLGWCDASTRDAAWGESYFDPAEMQQDTARFRTLLAVLRNTWGEGVASLFQRAWQSETLADCATFGEWLLAMPDERPFADYSDPHWPGPVALLLSVANDLQQQENYLGALTIRRKVAAEFPLPPDMLAQLTSTIRSNVASIREIARRKNPPEHLQVSPPYTVLPVSNREALIVYIIKLSPDMRLDCVMTLLMKCLQKLLFSSTKGGRIAHRYRVAIITYDSSPRDELGGCIAVHELARRGLPLLQHRNRAQGARADLAFEMAEELIIGELELHEQRQCPAPLVCHITDGCFDGSDPRDTIERIKGLRTIDGNVLIENVLASGDINLEGQTAGDWSSLTCKDHLMPQMSSWYECSSSLPESYRVILQADGYSLTPGIRMLWPVNYVELIQHCFSRPVNTGVPIR